MTLKNEARTAKSPQAGHHVGWSAFSCFLVSFSAGWADVVSDNLRTALTWLEVPLDGLAADRLRKGVFGADIDASPKQVELSNWTVDIDNTRIGGGLSLVLRDRPAFGLSLVVDKVNLDAYLPARAHRPQTPPIPPDRQRRRQRPRRTRRPKSLSC